MTLLRIGMAPESEAVIERHRQEPARVRSALRAALLQGLNTTAARLKLNYLSGTYNGSLRNGNPPLAVRTGALRQAVVSELDQPPWSGVVGTAQGPASAYARAQLDNETRTIKPRSAKHLWIPLPDNLTGGGVMKMSPRAAMSVITPGGKRALRIFRSKKGNLVAFMPGKTAHDDVLGTGATFAFDRGKHKRGPRKGETKGQLLFVLKDSVTLKGSDGLARAVQDKTEHIAGLIQAALRGDQGDQG